MQVDGEQMARLRIDTGYIALRADCGKDDAVPAVVADDVESDAFALVEFGDDWNNVATSYIDVWSGLDAT